MIFGPFTITEGESEETLYSLLLIVNRAFAGGILKPLRFVTSGFREYVVLQS